MADKLTREARSLNMSKIKSKNTLLEIKVRKDLYALGYRYRVNYKIKGHPDIVFPSKKLVIFIHGCFWHLHGCKNSSIPKSNTVFWRKKLEGNKARDNRILADLTKEHWRVIVIWECRMETNYKLELTTIIDLLNRLQK